MLKFLALALLIGAAPAPAPPLPLCRVTATSRPAPGLSVEFIGLPFRLITVTAGASCLPARVALSNYNGRSIDAPYSLAAEQSVTFGPVPLYRRLVWLAASGTPYNVQIRSLRGAP